MFDIKDGKISPWLLLNCRTGKELLARMDDTQLNAIANVINPEVWLKKFKKNKDDMDMIKFVVKEMVT
jgi:uroporphyrinogen-III decarboxylase